MSDKYRLHAWLELRLDEHLEPEQARLRLLRALHNIGDVPVNVLCEGPVREDTAR
jgi:hypothetical protein